MTAVTPEQRLAASGFDLPKAPKPKGHYAPYSCVVSSGIKLVSISGQTCRIDGVAMQGICTEQVDLEKPRVAARVAMLNTLAALKLACEDELGQVTHLARLRGFVRSNDGFTAHTAVLDAASEILAIAFPGLSLPARTAVGVSSLPDRAWVELELDVHTLPDSSPMC
ncbi:RidA family protein [Pseudomonas abietaniphila]|jgi:enamine deaminase RidA (YjgF/YER057c/UK114 family)